MGNQYSKTYVWPCHQWWERRQHKKILNSRIQAMAFRPATGKLKNIVYDNRQLTLMKVTSWWMVICVQHGWIYQSGKRLFGRHSDCKRAGWFEWWRSDSSVYNINVTNNVVTNTAVRSVQLRRQQFPANSTITNNTIGPTYNNTDAIYVRGTTLKSKNNLAYPNKIVLDTGLGATGSRKNQKINRLGM